MPPLLPLSLPFSHMDAVDDYMHKKLLAGRILVPFSRKEVELVLRGAFQSSLLIIAVQPIHPNE